MVMASEKESQRVLDTGRERELDGCKKGRKKLNMSLEGLCDFMCNLVIM